MSELEIQAAAPITVALADIKIDPDLQCRAAGTQKEVVADYAAAMRNGAVFPPVVLFRDARGLLLANGFHRVAAAAAAGLTEIAAEVREGSRRDALLYAASADQAVGLRRSTADKRRAVRLVLAACPKWSNRKVAEACGVDDKTVAAVKRSLEEPSAEIPHPEGEGNPAVTETEAPDPEAAILEKLTRAARKLVAQCPEAKRVELWAAIGELFEAKPSGG